MTVGNTGNPETQTTQAQPDGIRWGLPFIGLMAVQIFIGYEWLISGLTKLVRGGFPAGLADQLTESSEGAPGWYVRFLDHAVIPHGDAFGYLIEISELLIGIALIAGALVWLFAWGRSPVPLRAATLAVIALSALGGFVMAVSFHLADGSLAQPWQLPNDLFAEGVDIDSLVAAVQLALLAVSGGLLWGMWRSRRTVDA